FNTSKTTNIVIINAETIKLNAKVLENFSIFKYLVVYDSCGRVIKIYLVTNYSSSWENITLNTNSIFIIDKGSRQSINRFCHFRKTYFFVSNLLYKKLRGFPYKTSHHL